MIDEDRTMQLFLYTGDELKPQSNKRIVAVCDECGTYRVVPKYAYRDMCRSCAAKKRCEDLELRERQTVALKKTWDDPEKREMQSATLKKVWEDPELRTRQSSVQRKRFEDPKERELQSLRCREGWANQDVRDRASIAHKRQWADPDAREKLRLAQINRWSAPAEHERQSATLKKVWEDPELREKARLMNLKRYEDPADRIKTSATSKKMWADTEFKQSRRIAQTKRYEDPVEREKLSAAVQGIPYDEWEGFATDSPYCPKFNEACRESNREKYDRRCFLSGTTEDDNGQKLSVHHVDMNKNQGCDGHVWKLVPLCKKLHSTAHTPTWTARIVYLLEHVWNQSDIFTKGV